MDLTCYIKALLFKGACTSLWSVNRLGLVSANVTFSGLTLELIGICLEVPMDKGNGVQLPR